MSDDVAAFGAQLRAKRQAAGLSQQELAERSGMSIRAISNLERGLTRWPYPDSLRRLADALALRGAAQDEFIAAAGRRLAPPVPQQLPAPVAHFIGREAELAALTRLMDPAGASPPSAMVISAIGGTAGVGKTALAVRWAHRVAGHFPDGQLYVNLHGYDEGQPVPAADALAAFLRALGLAGPAIPADADERAAAYRSRISGRRMLVVLDNAREAEQVRPLLPGTASCTVVVTSRDALAGLVAREGATRLEVGLLPVGQAVGLLRELIGARVEADPEAAVTLARRCCRLPLALRLAAELAIAHPDAPLAGLAAELADLQHRLDLLEPGGDPRTAMRGVFSWSYRHLDPAAARVFRLAGLHPGADFDDYAIAALTGDTLREARKLLAKLARAYLVQPGEPGRYSMHDLLRGYARELAAGDGDDAQRAALTGLFDYYLGTAATAMDAVLPAQRHRRPRIAAQAAAPAVTGADQARAWLDTELENLVAAAAQMAAGGWPGHAIRLAATVFSYFEASGRVAEAASVQSQAMQAARRTGDRAAEATALTNLGIAYFHQGRYRQATGSLTQALTLFRQTGDRMGEARALANAGAVAFPQGRYQQAAEHLEQALTLFRQIGDRFGEARALSSLAVAERRLGRYQQAVGHLNEALALCRDISDRRGEAEALTSLGVAERERGRLRQATGHLQQALALCRDTGNRHGEAEALTNLGRVDLQGGRTPRAARHLRQALALCRDIGYRHGEAEAVTNLGLAELQQGHHQRATGHFQQALALCRDTGNRVDEAEVLNGLGDLLLAEGRPDQARSHYATAFELASQAGDEDERARAERGLTRAAPETARPAPA